MKTKDIKVAGKTVTVAEAGQGRPILYLHGFADVHAASVEWLPIHTALAESHRVLAPAHPACAGSDEDEEIENIDDVTFHYLEVMDALGLDRVDIVGACIGGWIGAELAVRNPERVGKLVLIGASGLFIPNEPIGDLFWEVQAQNGIEYRGLRELMFSANDHPGARDLFPDGRSDLARGMSLYKSMRFASRVGFKPPYFYNRKLTARLHRFGGPALLVWGSEDRMVPIAHAEAYRAGLAGKTTMKRIEGAGHSVHVEQPRVVAAAILKFLDDGAAAKPANKKSAAKKSKAVAKKAPAKSAPIKSPKSAKKAVKRKR